MTAPLEPSLLYHACDLSLFDFKTTQTLQPLGKIIGQERALDAVAFGAAIRQDGYNLYAMGPAGIGKHSAVMAYLRTRADTEAAPNDWCYVNNFGDPRKPIALELPPGGAPVLRKEMEELIEMLRSTLPALFESTEYRNARELISHRYMERQNAIFQHLSEEAKARDIAMRNPAEGRVTFAPIIDGKVLSSEEFQALPEADKKRIQEKLSAFETLVREALRDVNGLNKSMQKAFRELDHRASSDAVAAAMDELRETYAAYPRLTAYLDAVQEDIINNVKEFLTKPDEMELFPFVLNSAPSFQRYKVNVFVSHEKRDAAPLLFEDNPTLRNLIGDVEHMAQIGALVTDFSLIKPGALHRANGGYLVIDMRKLLMQPFAWEALKRVLRSKEIRIESLAQQYSLISSVSLEPEPIPIDIKIVLVGDRILYYLLYEYDPEFNALFKVVADFEEAMDRSETNTMLYAQLVATMARDNALMPLSAEAVGRVIEQASRYAEDSGRLSTHLGSLSDLLKEADYWVRDAERTVIETGDIDKALQMQRQRVSRLQERLYDRIAEGTLMVSTSGGAVGQVNGLSVIELGGYRFGTPTRITARTRIGKGEIIDIARQVKLGGPIHSKGVLTLSGYLGATYARDTPLSLSASLVFEQSYGPIEGDSASTAELFALLSSLADLPVRQEIAVTGSVNQFGALQAIGGVNEKIECFFDICARLDPKGAHGVIIPAANVRHLMLKPEVIRAVETGAFAIYAVGTVNEGIEILTGTPAGETDATGNYPPESVNGRVVAQLASFADAAKAFAKNGPDRLPAPEKT